MKMNKKTIALAKELIKNNQIEKIKDLVEKGLEIHFYDDYFLYLASFYKNKDLQKYFVDLGLNPETIKGRLEVAQPKELEFLRKYKNQKEIKAEAFNLSNVLSQKENLKTKKIKV